MNFHHIFSLVFSILALTSVIFDLCTLNRFIDIMIFSILFLAFGEIQELKDRLRKINNQNKPASQEENTHKDERR